MMRAAILVMVTLLAGSGCATTAAKRTPTSHRSGHVAKNTDHRGVAGLPAEDTTDGTAKDGTKPPPSESAPDQAAEEGMASYYADSLAGNRTANGERYRPGDSTCAHRKHKFGTKLVVTNTDNGKSAVCRVNDRGPYVDGRVVDVSKHVAGELGMLKRGVIHVKVERAVEGAGS